MSFFLEKAMATHSSILAWKIPWTEEPGRLQSMGLPRVGHDWATSLSLFTFMHWRRKWQPTPVFLPGESQGQGSLVGCCLWGRTELDSTEGTQQQQQQHTIKMIITWYWCSSLWFSVVCKFLGIRNKILVLSSYLGVSPCTKSMIWLLTEWIKMYIDWLI